MSATPAWQTDELAEEWPDSSLDLSLSGSEISLTRPIPASLLVTPERSFGPDGPGAASDQVQDQDGSNRKGTFLVREELPPPVLPQIDKATPGAKGKFGKDMFAPLQLERMFDPPSPPRQSDLSPPQSQPPQPQSTPPFLKSAPSGGSNLIKTAPARPSPLSQVAAPASGDSTIASSDEIVETDIPNLSFNGRQPSMHCQFTFNVPPPSSEPSPVDPPDVLVPSRTNASSLHPNSAYNSPSGAGADAGTSPGDRRANVTPLPSAPSGLAGVQSTPNPIGQGGKGGTPFAVNTPMTDPRLRLFHFQYDTFTREHLSAIVDSIAINNTSHSHSQDTPSSAAFSPAATGFPSAPRTPVDIFPPSGSMPSNHDSSRSSQFSRKSSRAVAAARPPLVQRLSNVAEATELSHLRSAKRVKLSPSAYTDTEVPPLSEAPPRDSASVVASRTESARTGTTGTTDYLYGPSKTSASLASKPRTSETSVATSATIASKSSKTRSTSFARTSSADSVFSKDVATSLLKPTVRMDQALNGRTIPEEGEEHSPRDDVEGHQETIPGFAAVDEYGEGAGAGAVISRPRSAGVDHRRTSSATNLRPPTQPTKSLAASTPSVASRHPNERPSMPARRDYVSESQSLMQQIKKARDFSTISTVASLADDAQGEQGDVLSALSRNRDRAAESGRQKHRPPALRVTSVANVPAGPSSAVLRHNENEGDTVRLYPPDVPGEVSVSPGGTIHSRPASGLEYRQQAAELMAQIKQGTRRIFSATTDNSHISHSTRVDVSDVMVPSADAKGKDVLAEPVFVMHVGEPGEYGVHGRHESSRTQVEASFGSGTGTRKGSPRKRVRTASGSATQDELVASMKVISLTPRPPIAVMTIPPTPTADQVAHAELVHPSSPRWLVPPATAVQGMPAGTGAGYLGPAPAYPSNSVRVRTNEDLNRFVSSSTVTSGTGTLVTAASIESYVKHSGPKQITRIMPGDVGVPDRVGRMVFDRVMMRWVRDTEDAMVRTVQPVAEQDGEGSSDDPFRDIESFREGSDGSRRSVSSGHRSNLSPLDEAEAGDEQEADLNSFSFDDPAMGVVQVMTGVETDDTGQHEANATIYTDSDSDAEREGTDFLEMTEMSESLSTVMLEEDIHEHEGAVASTGELDPARTVVPIPQHPAAVDGFGTWSSSTWPRTEAVATPLRGPRLQPPTPVIRPFNRSMTVTPMSAMKDPSRQRFATPQNQRGHARSVSFSDGKREGPIVVGLHEISASDVAMEEIADIANAARADSSLILDPSARSKRLAEMMHGLEDSGFSDDSPSKDSGRPAIEVLQPLTARRPSTSPSKVAPTVSTKINGDVSRRVFSRTQSFAQQRGNGTDSKINATFLTECSFAVSHDRLVQVITDVQPFEPYWEELSVIDLSKKNVDSVARLKEFLPKLDSLSLNSNQLNYLSGVPSTVRTLSVARNLLSSLTSFDHLRSLEHLDVSHNELDSLRQLACLRHLRELRADGNKITSLDGLQTLDGLIKLSAQNNKIREVNMSEYSWARLEVLNLADNRVETIADVTSLAGLVSLSLDNNALTDLEAADGMPRLRILRVSGNKLHRLNLGFFPNLRTLYADNNSLTSLVKAHKLTKLENLSLRNQNGKGLQISIRDVRDVKRLYLSGNRLNSGFITEPCYNLLYLELAACRLTGLPAEMARLVPNVRVLNLNYNFLDEDGVHALQGLTRLKKLTMIGSRLKGTKALIHCVRSMPDVEMLDFRMNPCTLGWYLPLLVRDVPGALQPSEGADTDQGSGTRRGGEKVKDSWQELDAKFRRDLPDEEYAGRLAYRGLIMKACPGIRLLDGVEVSEKEKDKASRLLAGIMAKTKKERRPATAS